MRITIILFLYFVPLYCLSQARENSFYENKIELIESLQSGNYRKASKIYYELELDTIFLQEFCKAKIFQMENKLEASVVECEKVLNTTDSLPAAYYVGFYPKLRDVYFESGHYDRLVEIGKKRLELLNNVLNGIEYEGIVVDSIHNVEISIKAQERFLELDSVFQAQPPMQIVRTDASNLLPSKFQYDDNILVSDVTFCDKTVRGLLDTGYSSAYFVMNFEQAQKLNLRPMSDATPDIYWADSISFANIKMYNVPVAILDDLNKDLFEEIDVLIGLKTFLKLEKVNFDFENNYIEFPHPPFVKINQKRNIYIDDRLFAMLNISDHPLDVLLDTGASSFLNINDRYYQKHKLDINFGNLTPDTTLVKRIEITHEEIWYDTDGLQFIDFGDYKVSVGKKLSKRESLKNVKSFLLPDDLGNRVRIGKVQELNKDGLAGINFLRFLGNKVSLDFVNMRVDRIE